MNKLDLRKYKGKKLVLLQSAIDEGIDARWVARGHNLKEMNKIKDRLISLRKDYVILNYDFYGSWQRVSLTYALLDDSVDISAVMNPKFTSYQMDIMQEMSRKGYDAHKITEKLHYSYISAIRRLLMANKNPELIIVENMYGNLAVRLATLIIEDRCKPFLLENIRQGHIHNEFISEILLLFNNIEIESFDEYERNKEKFKILLDDIRTIDKEIVNQYACLYNNDNAFWFTRELATGLEKGKFSKRC